MKQLTAKLSLSHIKKYGQYTQNVSWARWYAHVAPLKAKRVVKTLRNFKNTQAMLLDLGCGTGMTFATVSQAFPSAVALDIGDREIMATKELLKKLGVSRVVKKYDGKIIPYPSNSFDIVTSIEVIEHVADSDFMLREIRRVLKTDGILHITTANKLWPVEPHFKLPFLSYLPSPLSDWYVRITGRGSSYENIKLPTYRQFYSMVEKYFTIADITLDVISQYRQYGLDKERGALIPLIGKAIAALPHWLKPLILNVSLGWLFIARPKK